MNTDVGSIIRPPARTSKMKCGLKSLMHVPLLGTLIIAVFKRMKSLPENKVRLYDIFIDLMCGGWDLAKNVARETRFGSSNKAKVLTSLAASLHLNHKREATEWDVSIAVSKVMPALADQWKSLLGEFLEDGLLMRLSSGIVFAHLSFQEFLAARDLNDPTGMRQTQVLRMFLRGDDWWGEVLAFYIALTSRPEELEAWIVKVFNSVSNERGNDDAVSRCKFLITRLAENCPGWSPNKAKLPLKIQRTLDA